jgi:hypothetical protein
MINFGSSNHKNKMADKIKMNFHSSVNFYGNHLKIMCLKIVKSFFFQKFKMAD